LSSVYCITRKVYSYWQGSHVITCARDEALLGRGRLPVLLVSVFACARISGIVSSTNLRTQMAPMQKVYS